MNERTASARDRLVELRVEGLRALADVRLPLNGLTALIGENGTGKSSIVEAFEIVRAATTPGFFVDHLVSVHGGLAALLRSGAPALRISTEIQGAEGARIEYVLALARHGTSVEVAEERLGAISSAHDDVFIDRNRSACRLYDAASGRLVEAQLHPGQLGLTAFGVRAPPLVQRVLDVLSRGSVHVPFHVNPLWVSSQPSPLRMPSMAARAERLDRLGGNLANCFHQLLNSPEPAVRERILERVRVGLGLDVTAVTTPPAHRGEIELHIQFQSLPSPIPAASLSDGQLSYLAFIALIELGASGGFLVVDEPESHLHPDLLVRLVWMLEELSRATPVVISTHSDRLLDALSAPEESVLLCDLDERRATRLLRPDKAALARWLERYSGLGELRAAGYGAHVLTDAVGTGR